MHRSVLGAFMWPVGAGVLLIRHSVAIAVGIFVARVRYVVVVGIDAAVVNAVASIILPPWPGNLEIERQVAVEDGVLAVENRPVIRATDSSSHSGGAVVFNDRRIHDLDTVAFAPNGHSSLGLIVLEQAPCQLELVVRTKDPDSTASEVRGIPEKFTIDEF